MRSLLFCLVAAVLLSVPAGVCKAGPVTVTFEGPLDYVSSVLAGRFSLGDLMQVSITYESSWPDGNSNSYSGFYECIQSFSVFVDSTDDYTATATDGWWTINNDFPPPPDTSYADQVFAYVNSSGTTTGGTLDGPDVEGLPLWMFSLQLEDSSMTALSSDALPLSFDPGAFDNDQIKLYWRDGTVNRWISASNLTSTSYVVPAPGAALLGVLGLLCLRAGGFGNKKMFERYFG